MFAKLISQEYGIPRFRRSIKIPDYKFIRYNLLNHQKGLWNRIYYINIHTLLHHIITEE